MHEPRRWPAALVLSVLAALAAPAAAADEPDYTDVNAYILQAEMALQRDDYLMAVREYRKAAELSDNPDVARQAAATGLVYGFDEEALRAAKRWVELDGDSREARLFLAELSYRTGDTRAAKRHFARLVDGSDEPPGEALVELLPYLSKDGDPADADAIMRTLAKPHGDASLAHYAVATLALRSGDVEHAIERVQRAIELDPDHLKSKLLYSRALLARGDVDEAIDYTARIVGDEFDPDPDARMELAILYMMADRADDALSQVNQILLEQSDRTDAVRLMAIINYHEGRLDAAWDDFNEILMSGQFRMDALFYLGRISDERAETDRAIRFYSEVRRGSNAMAAQRRAAMLLVQEKDDLKGALRLLDDFADDSPSNAVAATQTRAMVLAMAREYDEALEYYDKAVRFRPDDESTILSRAELLVRMDRIDEALESYADAVRRWPKSALSLNAYGYTLADRTDRYREAEKLIRRAIKYEPDSPAIIDSLGWVLFKLGDLEEALVQLERAYAGLPDHEVAAHIVETLVALGRRDEALERLEAAEEQTPGSELLEDVRQRLFGDAP